MLRRDGAQRTWVAFDETAHGGIQTMVLRPGFVGDVEEFGMLIPFPSPPAIRKVDENIFSHIEAAVDPPPMAVDVSYPMAGGFGGLIGLKGTSMGSGGLSSRGTGVGAGGAAVEPALGYYEVEVLREEAVGMYEVAVLQAGSPEALQRWMTANDFAWPEGMEEPVWAYVEARWCFVAIKAHVGSGQAAVPFPGMRSADTGRPEGSSFDGFVQAMGFRFVTDEPVLPMRLSVHNPTEGRPRNVVYMLTDEGVALTDLDHGLVERQVDGAELLGHLDQPIPLWFRSGEASHVNAQVFDQFADRRQPARYNGVARALFASDLAAFQTGSMELSFEQDSTELLNISESLGLRGEAIDERHAEVVEEQREEQLGAALDGLPQLTLTVLDGSFDPAVLARQNLGFEPFTLADEDNGFRIEALKPRGPEVSVPSTWRPPPPPPPTIHIGAPTVTGGMDKTQLSNVLKRHTNQFLYCYRRELVKDPTLSGRVVLKLVVAADGQVTDTTVRSSSMDNPIVDSCLARRFDRIKLPSTGHGISVVTLPMTFGP